MEEYEYDAVLQASYPDEYEYMVEEEDISLCAVPGSCPDVEVKAVAGGAEQTARVSQYKGKFLVIVFYRADWECEERVAALAGAAARLPGTVLVGCSADSPAAHLAWQRSGGPAVPLWSDQAGRLARQFDLWDYTEGGCRDGLAIIDDAGVVRQVMTSGLEQEEAAAHLVTTVAELKKNKAGALPQPASKGSLSAPAGPAVRIDVAELEKDWDVSTDPELQKVLNVAKMLGRTRPARTPSQARTPMFDMMPATIRGLANCSPRAPVRCVMASLQRNLAGYGASADISGNQRLQLENLMKKVMGVAYMPEDLTGKFYSLSKLNQREQTNLLEREIFRLTDDDWMSRPGAVRWSEGQGVFINNYNTFVLWVNQDDQLRLESVAKGRDLKFVLLRLQKAIARIEEALKMVFSTKSCQQRGFTTANGAFVHSRREVYRTGFEVVLTMELIGFERAGQDEIEKAKTEFNVKIDKCRKGPNTFNVVLNQSPDDTEEVIVRKSVVAVDGIARMDAEIQSRLGVKLTL